VLSFSIPFPPYTCFRFLPLLKTLTFFLTTPCFLPHLPPLLLLLLLLLLSLPSPQGEGGEGEEEGEWWEGKRGKEERGKEERGKEKG
jgi:hypothetical protein